MECASGFLLWNCLGNLQKHWGRKMNEVDREKGDLPTMWLSGDTLQNCPSRTTTPPSHPLPVTVSVTVSVRHTLRHTLRHILCHTLHPSHFPLHHPTPPTPSIHFTFPHTVDNSISVECLYLRGHLCHFP